MAKNNLAKFILAFGLPLFLAGCPAIHNIIPESTPIPAPTTKPLEKISYEVEGKDGLFLANNITFGQIDYPGGDWTIGGEYEREINVNLPQSYNQSVSTGSLVRLDVSAPGKAIIKIKDGKIIKEKEIFGFGNIEYYIPQHTSN